VRLWNYCHAFCLGVALLAGCPSAHTQPVPEDVKRQIEEARQQAQSGDRAAAEQKLEEIAHQSPGSASAAEALFAKAELDFDAKEYVKARDEYRELLLQYPLFDRSDRAKLHLGLALAALGETRDALATLSPLYERAPPADKPAIAAQLSQVVEGAGSIEDAVKWLAEAAKVAVDEAAQKEALAKAVELIDSKATFLDVRKLVEDLGKDSPLAPTARFKLARIYAHLRDYANEREALQAFVADYPDNPFTPEARKMLERTEQRAQVKPDAVGVVLPLSGKNQPAGEAVLRGINLALGAEKGRNPVTLVVKDTAGDPAQAKKAVTDLALDEHVIAIIGPVMVAESGDAATEADLQEVPIVTVTRLSRVTDLGPYVFRNMLTDEEQARALADYAVRVQGDKRFALLFPEVQYGQNVATAFWDSIEASGGEVRGAESYVADTTTFSNIIKKLVGRMYWQLQDREDYKEAERQIRQQIKDPFRQHKALEELKKHLDPIVDFDAVLIADGAQKAGLIAPALAAEDIITTACDPKELDNIEKTLGKKPGQIKLVHLLGGSAWDSPDLIQVGGKSMECSVFVDGFFAGSDRPPTRKFVQAFRAITQTKEQPEGRDPNLLEAMGYDTGRIVRQIIEKDRPTTRAAFRESLLHVKDFPGATGKTTFQQNREATRQLFFLEVHKGEIHELPVDGEKS
jgi:branched-chain amino acid transport system substrate-binding protein